MDNYEERIKHYIYIYIYNTAVLIKICRFLINVVKFFTQTLTKLDLPTLRKGSIEERTQRNKIKSDTRWESNPGPGFSSDVR